MTPCLQCVALTFCDYIRLADLRRLGQVGTGTSGTVWLVAFSACAAQQAWTEHDKLFQGAPQGNRSQICSEANAKAEWQQQGKAQSLADGLESGRATIFVIAYLVWMLSAAVQLFLWSGSLCGAARN